jgi:hypothetical protein
MKYIVGDFCEKMAGERKRNVVTMSILETKRMMELPSGGHVCRVWFGISDKRQL